MVTLKQSRKGTLLPGLSGGDRRVGSTQWSWWSGLGLLQERRGHVRAAPGLAVSWLHVAHQLMERPRPQKHLVTSGCLFLWFQVETRLDRVLKPRSCRGPRGQSATGRDPGSPHGQEGSVVQWLAQAWGPANLRVVSGELLHLFEPLPV